MLLRPYFRRGSLLTTLTIRLVATTVALTAVLLVVLYWQLQFHASNIFDRSLTSQAEDIAGFLGRAPDGGLTISLPTSLAEAYSDANNGYSYQVRNASGAVLLASPHGAPELDEITASESDEPQFFLLAKSEGRKIYAASVPLTGKFSGLQIRVAQSMRHSDVLIDQFLEEFIKKIGWVLPLIAGFFLIVNIITVRRSLSPVETISAMAAKIGPSDPSPLPEVGLPAEVRPLVRAANSAFARLGEALRTQREFTADAAHELRTPLAVLGANIDTIEDSDAKVALQHDLRVMTRIVDQLLKVAQLEAFDLDIKQPADLCRIATAVAARLGPRAIEQEKSISLDVPEAAVIARGHSIILQHGLINLVENALSHTPEGGCVTITVEASGTIHVDDEGPGVPENERALVFRRFWRKTRNAPGAGIGLSIVAKIAEAHEGSIRISTAPCGGARFSLALPLYA